MTTSSDRSHVVENLPDTVLHQSVLGSRRLSNVLVALAVTFGGFGFSLASLSSRFGLNFLPAVSASTIPWLPQGLVMGLYGIAALLLALYLWFVIFLDLGGGSNRFDKANGIALITRQGLRQLITVEIPLRDIQAVKVEIRDGLSPQRRLTLKVKGRRDLPLSRIGEPVPLAELEVDGAKLARFIGVPLEGL